MDTTLILATPPEDLRRAVPFGHPVAHMAYRIGQGGHLFRTNIPLSLKGGFMVLGEEGHAPAPDAINPDMLAAEVIRECLHRGFDGVVLAFTRTSPALHAFAAVLAGRLKRQGGALYLPEAYADDSDWARVLIPTAISGGSLLARLQEVIRYYGHERVCLDIERVRLDFCMPSDTGQGQKLSARELYTLIRERAPQSYFSQDLAAYYFTYQDESGSHFVLYDDAGSIRKKLFLAQRLGIDQAMLLFPEIEDILEFLSPSEH